MFSSAWSERRPHNFGATARIYKTVQMFPTSIFYAIEKIDHEQKRRQNVGVADCALAEEIGKLWSRRVTLAQDSPTSGHPMNQAVTQLFLLVLLWLLPAVSLGQETQSSASKVRLGPTTKLDLINADIKWVKYHGRHALHVVPLTGHEHAVEEDMLAVLSESDFEDGTIEVDVAGSRWQGYSTVEDDHGFKGFIGVSFRVQDKKGETFFVRPINARLDNQLFGNRSTQYESIPDFSWKRLREESPEVYESYVDLQSGAWTKLRIEVSGMKARMYVNGAAQPCLIVNDLKHGYGHGKVALWAHVSTDGYSPILKVELAP